MEHHHLHAAALLWPTNAVRGEQGGRGRFDLLLGLDRRLSGTGFRARLLLRRRRLGDWSPEDVLGKQPDDGHRKEKLGEVEHKQPPLNVIHKFRARGTFAVHQAVGDRLDDLRVQLSGKGLDRNREEDRQCEVAKVLGRQPRIERLVAHGSSVGLRFFAAIGHPALPGLSHLVSPRANTKKRG